jgi:hypothetical protein
MSEMTKMAQRCAIFVLDAEKNALQRNISIRSCIQARIPSGILARQPFYNALWHANCINPVQ